MAAVIVIPFLFRASERGIGLEELAWIQSGAGSLD